MGRKQEVFGVTVEGDISGLKKVMNDAVRVFNSTERSLKKVNKALESDPTNEGLLADKTRLLKKQVAEGQIALQGLQKAMDDLVHNPNFDEGYTGLSENFIDLKLKIEKVKKETQQAREELAKMGSVSMQAFGARLQDMSKSLKSFADQTRYLSMAFGALLTSSVVSAKDYETSIAGIKRVVSDLSDETIEDLKEIAIQSGTAFDGIAEFATIGGALGIAQKDLAEFAKTMTDLNTATGGAFEGEEGAKSVVVFLKQLGLSIDDLDNFGSAIAVIGDRYADIGDETLTLATNLSSLATIANVSQFDLIGLAGVMADLGLSSEAATSGITRSFTQIEKALDGSVDGIEGFAKLSGMTVAEFRKQWERAPLDTFMKFVDGLKTNAFSDIDRAVKNNTENLKEYADVLGVSQNKFKEMWNKDDLKTFDAYTEALGNIDDENVSAIGSLAGVKLNSVRTIQTLLRLAGRGKDVAEAVDLASDAWRENTALTRKANGIYDTTERKLQGMFEALKQAGASLGNTLLPFFQDLIENVTELAEKFADLDPNVQQLVVSLAAYGALLSPLARGTSKLLGFVGEALKSAYPLVKLLGGSTGIVALIGALATGIGTMAYQMSKTPLKESFKDIVNLRKAYDELDQSIDNIVAKKDFDLIGMGQAIEKIADLQNSITKGNILPEDEDQAVTDLKTELDKLNEALGYTAFWFDETTGVISDQNGPVYDLKSAWDDLADSIRKAYYVEQYQALYEDALKNQKQLMDDNLKAITDYKSTMDALGPQYEKWVELYKTDPSEYGKRFANQDRGEQESIKKAVEAWVTLQAVQSGVMSHYERYQQDIDNFNALLHGTPEEVENAMNALNYGFNVDPAKNSVDELQTKVDDLKYALDNGEGFTDEYKQGLQDQLSVYQEQLDLAKQAQDTFNQEKSTPSDMFSKEDTDKALQSLNNVYYGENGWVPTNERAVEEIGRGIKESVLDTLGQMVLNFILNYDQMQSYASANPIVITTKLKNNANLGAGYSVGGRVINGGISIDSGGFGFRSGMMAGSITLNNTFTINNGADINQQVVEAWADVMTDRINENLGKIYD